MDGFSCFVSMGNLLEEFFTRGNSYWLTRFVILRLLGFVYAVAFLIAAQQLVPLVGEHGLTPASHYFARIQEHFGSRSAAAIQLPSLFWFGISDQGLINLRLDWLWSLAGCPWRIRKCNSPRHSLGHVHVHHSRRANLVWLRLGDAITRNRVSLHFPLSVARWSAISEMPAANSGDLAISLARLSHHDWRRPDQAARRSLLARSYLPLLSLRNTTNPESAQPLSAFCAALVPQIRYGLESFHRTDRSLVFFRATKRATHCRCVAREFSDHSDHQREPVVLELRNYHSVSRLL